MAAVALAKASQAKKLRVGVFAAGRMQPRWLVDAFLRIAASEFAEIVLISVEEGSLTTLHCATSPDVAEHTGRYYDSCREKAPNPISDDAKLAAELWARSEEWVAPFAS